jgi:hypothetical protein
METIRQNIMSSVAEAVLRFAGDDASVQKVGQIAVEGNLSQADYDADAGERLYLLRQMGGTIANLLRSGLVAGRGAAHDRSDPGMFQPEAIVTRDGTRLAGETELMKDRVHEVAGAIAGKGPSCPISSMRPRGKAQDEDAGEGIAEAGDGTSPIRLILICTAFNLADTFAVVAKARTLFAGDDRLANLFKNY